MNCLTAFFPPCPQNPLQRNPLPTTLGIYLMDTTPHPPVVKRRPCCIPTFSFPIHTPSDDQIEAPLTQKTNKKNACTPTTRVAKECQNGFIQSNKSEFKHWKLVF